MKNILLIIFFFAFSSLFSQSIAEKNKKQGYYQITSVNPDKNMAYDETRIIFTFLGPTNSPARNGIKLVCNNDSVFPQIDINGNYTVELDPGKYKMRFSVPYWHMIKTVPIECKSQTTTKITVRFEAQDLKPR